MSTQDNPTKNSAMDTTDGSGDAVACTSGANNGHSNAVTTATAVAVSSSIPSSSAATIPLTSQATAQIFTTPTTPLASGPISVSMSPNVAQQPIQVQVQGPYLQPHTGYYYQNANPMLCTGYIAPQLGSVQPLQLQLHSGGGISHMATAVSSPAKVVTSSVAKTVVSGNTFTMTPTSVATTAQFSQQFKNVAPALARSVQSPYPPNTLIQLNPHSFMQAAPVQPATSSTQAIAAKTIAIDKKQNIVSTLQPKPTIMPNVTSQTSILRPMPAQIIQNIAPSSPFQFQPTFQTLNSNNAWLGAISSNPSLAIIRPSEQPSIQYALHASPQLQTISVHGAPLQIAPSSSIPGHLPQTMVSAMAAPTAIQTSTAMTANATGSASHSQNVNIAHHHSLSKLKPLAARPAASTASSTPNTSSSVTTVANPNSSSTPNKCTNVTSSTSATSAHALDSSSSSSSKSSSASNTTTILRSTKTLSHPIKSINAKPDHASEQNITDHKNQHINHANSVKGINSNNNAVGNKANLVTRMSGEPAHGPGLNVTKGNLQTGRSTPGMADGKGNKEVHQRSSIDLRGTKRPTERREIAANATSVPSRDVLVRNGINKNKTPSPMQVAPKKNEPSVLVHVIENFVIEESTHPFPVSENAAENSLVKENGNHKESDHHKNNSSANSNNNNNNNNSLVPTTVQTQRVEQDITTPNGTKVGKPVECSNYGPKNSPRSRFRSRPTGKLSNNCPVKKTNGTEKTFNPVVGNSSEYDFNSSNEGDQSTRNEPSPVAMQPEAKRAKIVPKKANCAPINESRSLTPENVAVTHVNNKSPSQANGTVKVAEDAFIPPSGKDPHKWKVQDVYDFVRHLPGCEEYADEFRSQEIDGQALLLLEEKHLMSAMSMKLGPALKICSRIRELQADTNNTSR